MRQHDVFLAYSSVKHYNFLFVPALASSEPMTQHRWERIIPRALRRRAFQTRSRTGHLSPPFIAYRAGAADWRIPGRAEPPHRGPARPHPRMLTGAAHDFRPEVAVPPLRPDETYHRLLFWTYGQLSERLAGHLLAAEGYTS